MLIILEMKISFFGEATLPARHYQKFSARNWDSLGIWQFLPSSFAQDDFIAAWFWLKYSPLDLTCGHQPPYFYKLQILLTYPTVRAQRFIDVSKKDTLRIVLSKLLWTAMEVHKILPAVLCLVSVWEPCIKWSSLQFKFLFFFWHDLPLQLQIKHWLSIQTGDIFPLVAL